MAGNVLNDQFVKNMCMPGTVQCCRYLVMGPDGFQCAKLTEMKATLDHRVLAGQMNAVGDNCEGKPM